MLRVGLTGGIGSGKSTVAQRLRALGAVVVDADALAREVVEPGSEGLASVVERFGDDVLDDEGALNRPALGALVFADPAARRDLEAITHPLIARHTAALFAAAPPDAVVVHDVPLLVEKDMGAAYHLVLVVGAAEDTRVRRLAEARGMTQADARSRIGAQATDARRRAAADVWLDNDGPRDVLLSSVDGLWADRLVPFESNVRHGVRAPQPARVRLHDPDPTWPDQAARLLARLRKVLGDVVVTADHVGSTAVPGLAAKDVVDLQLGVRSLSDVDAPAVVAALAEAGFPRPEATAHDNAKDGTPWPKRFLASADPGRLANVHVREVGSPGWRWALQFRDWMCADAGARAEYAAEKHRLADGARSREEYADAKEPWFDSVHERAVAWATESGWEPEHG